jgi:hypothetical protein
VYQAYERILRELRVNQLREDVIGKVYRTIYKPLAEVSETQFDRTHSAVIDLRKSLDQPDQTVAKRTEDSRKPAEYARKQLNDLVEKLNSILSAMEGLAKINELIAELARIERQEEELESLVIKIHRKAILDALKDDR